MLILDKHNKMWLFNLVQSLWDNQASMMHMKMTFFFMLGLCDSISEVSSACSEINLQTSNLFLWEKTNFKTKSHLYFPGLKIKLRQKWNYNTDFYFTYSNSILKPHPIMKV